MDLRRRPAAPEDKEAVYRINCAAYHDVVVAQFGAWDEGFQIAHFEEKWNPAKYEVVTCGDEIIGVLAVEHHADHVFLSEIQIDPAHQNRGFGSEILRDLISASKRSHLPIRLRVLKLNRARQLYERLGFRQTGETERHFCMEWSDL
jgi:ribosomal protein S18 acetylase RimI-like enzyme